MVGCYELGRGEGVWDVQLSVRSLMQPKRKGPSRLGLRAASARACCDRGNH